MTVQLGAGFLLPPVVVEEELEPAPTLDDLRDEQILTALAALREALVEMPRPVVNVDAPDLSAIVTAVASLKPGADAEDVAAAVVRQLAPTAPEPVAPVLDKLTKALERLDFRLKGGFGGHGSGGVGSTVKNEIGTSLDVRDAVQDTRYEYTTVGTASKPLYVGRAPGGTGVNETFWRVSKYSYDTGPAGDSVVSAVQTAVGSWTQRAALFGGAVVLPPTPTTATYGTAVYGSSVYA